MVGPLKWHFDETTMFIIFLVVGFDVFSEK